MTVDMFQIHKKQLMELINQSKAIGSYNDDEFQKLILDHPDVFDYFYHNNNLYQLNKYLKPGKSLDIVFKNAVKNYFLNDYLEIERRELSLYGYPKWLESMNYNYIELLKTKEDLLNYDESVVLYNNGQRKILDTLNIDNIKRFEKETGFFSYKPYGYLQDLALFQVIVSFFENINFEDFIKDGLDFKNGTLSYSEFLDQFAICLDIMRKNNVFNTYLNYHWIDGEFRVQHPSIFIDPNAPQELSAAFYNNSLTINTIYKNKEFIDYIMDKDLSNLIIDDIKLINSNKEPLNFIKEYVSRYGNKKFLNLIAEYGNLLSQLEIDNTNNIISDENLINEALKRAIYEKIINKKVNYIYLENNYSFVLQYPQLFLAKDAPKDLRNCFYNYKLTFLKLSKHKEWMQYLKDKNLSSVLLKSADYNYDMALFFQMFGKEKAISLGINKAETVTEMIKCHQVELMRAWYDKTGCRFIPDFVVMQNFDIKDADKFLLSGVNWNNLMRLKSFSKLTESREAMLKLAYSFGVFDCDDRGFKQLYNLLTEVPKKIAVDKSYILSNIDNQISEYLNACKNQSDNVNHNNEIAKRVDKLLKVLKIENVHIDHNKGILKQLYKLNDDGFYNLIINQQSYPKTCEIIRNFLEDYRELFMMTPELAHKMFGGFKLKYDPDFREFLLNNINLIMSNYENISYISSVQDQFNDIKTINSNRTLTWALALNYVSHNKYISIDTGNEQLALISAIAGYSQSDFDLLQQIYNYGKQRTFSSIPHIEKNLGKYSYEMLRLDDPLALTIGVFTDCCQKLGDLAEGCMEHSMVSKDGRIFVIRDDLGNIVAQSWVWRNKNVLCFDNIEIPDKVFLRAIKNNSASNRKEISDEIYEVYKKAASDLLALDKRIYDQLLNDNKITQKQYDGLLLGKVTVGLGYNDIAITLKEKSYVDKETPARPLEFIEPVPLSKGLYTKDSVTQYVLEKRDNRKDLNVETLPIYSDTYNIYNDNNNIDEQSLLTLKKLELATKMICEI